MEKRRRKNQSNSSEVWTKDAITNIVEDAVLSLLKGCSEHLTADSNLMDAGIDSLGLVELGRLLQTRFDISLSSTFVFGHPTMSELVAYVNNELSHVELDDESVLPKTLQGAQTTSTVEITGMSFRFPGESNNLKSYWELMQLGKRVSDPIPFSRWDSAAQFLGLRDVTETIRKQVSHGAFVHDIESIDPEFFGLSVAEVRSISPQQRITLECAHLAFLDAGFKRADLKGRRCGVFVGMSHTTVPDADPTSLLSGYAATSSAAAVAAGRIPFVFDVHGPCSAYDTACSSSFVALDAAIMSLRSGVCDLALVTGVNELFDERFFLACASAGMLTPSGHCHTWDASADGFLRGEGCGAIVLCLSDSLELNSGCTSSYATVCAARVAHDGRGISMTAPNKTA